MLKVALLGHSQIRKLKIIPNKHQKILKIYKRGGKLDNFLTEQTKTKLENFKPDLIYVILGSNDLDQKQNTNKIISFKRKFEEFSKEIGSLNLELNYNIRFLEIEPRISTRINREEYCKVRKAINRLLRRKLGKYFLFTECKGIGEENIGTDGVHINARGRHIVREIIQKDLRKLNRE